MHHELLHRQQGVVADKLVLMMHVVHHQLLSAQLLNHSEGERGEERQRKREKERDRELERELERQRERVRERVRETKRERV